MEKKLIKIFSSGVFDILNLGHIKILTHAKSLGDYLIVAIQSDEYVKKYKGKAPILNINERVDQIKALPFVDDIVIYGDRDQRDIWDNFKPDIIVQGDDYIHSDDRTLALKYIKDNGIRLCLLPRTEDISSTEIKKRILESKRKDLTQLKNLKLLTISDLSIYEEYDELKVLKLVNKIKHDEVFYSPINVGKIKNKLIVTDGVNRVEALKRLGCVYISALVLPYEEIELTNNVHYIQNGVTYRLSEFANTEGKKIVFKKRSHTDIYNHVVSKEMIPNGETWHKPPYNIVNFKLKLKELKTGVDIEDKINKMIEANNVRYYQSGVYSCDEW